VPRQEEVVYPGARGEGQGIHPHGHDELTEKRG
jgi:hypothetical protein